MKAKWWMQKRAFDLLVYRISQLSCNGFVKKMREELYNRPSPKEEGQRENPLFTRRESYERILHEGRRFAFSAPPPCEFPYEFRINSIRAKKSFFNNIFPPIEKKFSSSHFENKLSLHFREWSNTFSPGGGEGGGLLLEGLKWCIEEAWNRYTLSVCVIISVSRVYRIESIGIIRTDIEPCKYNELRRIEKYRGRRVRNDRKIGEGEIDVDSKRWNNHIRIYHQQHFFRDVPHLSLERNRDAFDKYLVTS